MQIIYSSGMQSTEMAALTVNQRVLPVVKGMVLLAYYSYCQKMLLADNKAEVVKVMDDMRKAVADIGIRPYALDAVWNELKSSGRISDSAEDLGALANTLILWIKEFKDKSELAPILVRILQDSRRMARGSESGFESVSGNVGVLEDRTLSRHFVSRSSLDLKQQSIELLQKTVKKLGGTGNNLNTDERKRAKIDDPYNYEIFLDVLKQIRDKSRRFGRSWARMHNDDDGLVDYQQFVSAVSKNFVLHPFPSGFTGKMDDMFRLYTNKGMLLDTVPLGGTIVMNPNYDGESDNTFVYKAKPEAAENWARQYTMNYKSRSTTKRFKTVDSLDKKVVDIRRKWIRDIGNRIPDDPDVRTQCAMVMEIIYQTQARIGTVGNESKIKTGERVGQVIPTYGLTTVLMRHVKMSGQGIKIEYYGKSAGRQKHVLDPTKGALRPVVDYIKRMKQRQVDSRDRKMLDLPLFVSPRGGPLSRSIVNKYLKQLGSPATVHKFRHLKGTRMMAEILKGHPFKDLRRPVSTTEVRRWLENEAKKIGAVLGHYSGEKVTGNTAINAYCDPKMTVQLFRDAKAAIPTSILKALKLNPKAIDIQVSKQ